MTDAEALAEINRTLELYFEADITAHQAINTISHLTGLNSGGQQ